VTVEEARIASAEGVDAGQKLPAELLNRLPFDAGLMAQRLALHGFSGLSSSLQSMKF
jgi:hypothetical protein